MYYMSKGLEFLGLIVLVIGFIVKFPGLMDPKLFMIGIVCFGAGWIIERYTLQ